LPFRSNIRELCPFAPTRVTNRTSSVSPVFWFRQGDVPLSGAMGDQVFPGAIHPPLIKAGGEPRRLTDHPGADILPSWSRDGEWIHFSSTRGGDRRIWKKPAEGGEAARLTTKGGFEGFESSGGGLLLYSKDRDTPGIWSLSLEGGGEEP
jgi:hypothetical protein